MEKNKGREEETETEMCDVHVQFPTVNVIITYCKYTLIKVKII